MRVHRTHAVVLFLLAVVLFCYYYRQKDEPKVKQGRESDESACANLQEHQAFLKFVCTQGQLYRGALLMSFTNNAMIEMTTNWLLSLDRAGLNAYLPLILCGDRPSFEYFHAAGFKAYLVSPSSDIWQEVSWSKDDVAPDDARKEYLWAFGSEAVRISRSRFGIVYYLLKNGFTIFFHDVDLVLIRRTPVHAVDRVLDILEQGPQNVSWLLSLNRPPQTEYLEYNLGFYIVRPSPASLRLFNLTIELMLQQPSGDDQGVVNAIIANVTSDLASSVAPLPYEEFTPGRTSFYGAMHENHRYYQSLMTNWTIEDNPNIIVPYVLHANWIVAEGKIGKLKEWGLWWVGQPELVQSLFQKRNDTKSL